MARVVVVGLGPAGPELWTAAARDAIDRGPRLFLRTRRHPSAATLEGAASFDSLYESAWTLDAVYVGIVDALVAAARDEGEVVYAVPGSPLVAERTVELLRARARAGGGAEVEVEVVPALSFLDLAWAALGVDPLAVGARLVDGQRFATEAAGDRGPLLVAQCDSRDVLSAVKLAVEGDPPAKGAVILHHLGLPDELVREVAWADLDRTLEPDHLTSVYVPELGAPVAGELVRFAELVRTLRERCPWDRQQTHETLTRHLLEETYEVLEAVQALRAGEEGYVHLEEELGDLLFQVVFHATLAAEVGRFTLADVARTVHDKLVARHPHVFGDVEAATPEAVMRNWEQIKRTEKGSVSLMDGLPAELPALLYAHKVQRKAASAGLATAGLVAAGLATAGLATAGLVAAGLVATGPGRADQSALPALAAEVAAHPGPGPIGDLLFAAVNAAREADVDPEAALRAAAARFRDRFMALERVASAQGLDLTNLPPDDLDRLWSEAG